MSEYQPDLGQDDREFLAHHSRKKKIITYTLSKEMGSFFMAAAVLPDQTDLTKAFYLLFFGIVSIHFLYIYRLQRIINFYRIISELALKITAN